MKFIIAFLLLFLLTLAGCKEPLDIDSIITGVQVDEVVCFDTISGMIFWRCPEHEVRKKIFPVSITTADSIGFGCFSKTSEAFIPFKYSSARSLLTSSNAFSFEGLKACECYKRMKGPILKAIIQHYQNYAKKGLSAESPFFI